MQPDQHHRGCCSPCLEGNTLWDRRAVRVVGAAEPQNSSGSLKVPHRANLGAVVSLHAIRDSENGQFGFVIAGLLIGAMARVTNRGDKTPEPQGCPVTGCYQLGIRGLFGNFLGIGTILKFNVLGYITSINAVVALLFLGVFPAGGGTPTRTAETPGSSRRAIVCVRCAEVVSCCRERTRSRGFTRTRLMRIRSIAITVSRWHHTSTRSPS